MLISAVNTAICTYGEPVSPSFVAYSFIIAVFSSLVNICFPPYFVLSHVQEIGRGLLHPRYSRICNYKESLEKVKIFSKKSFFMLILLFGYDQSQNQQQKTYKMNKIKRLL